MVMNPVSSRRLLRAAEMLALLLALVGFTAVHRNTRIFSFQSPTRCHSISTEGDSDTGLMDESCLVDPSLRTLSHLRLCPRRSMPCQLSPSRRVWLTAVLRSHYPAAIHFLALQS